MNYILDDINYPIKAYGESITVGTGASSIEKSYAYLFAKKRGVLSNYASGSYQLSNVLNSAYSRNTDSTDKHFVLSGYNDMRNMGTDATKQGAFKSELTALLSWISIPNSQKVIGQSVEVTYTGTWLNTPAYGGAIGKYSSTQNATATFSVKGTAVVIGITKLTSNSGTFQVVIDGINKGTIGGNLGHAPVAGNQYAPTAFIFDGLSDGTHTVVLTVTTSGLNIYLDFAAGNDWCRPDAYYPVVFCGNCIKMNSAGYAVGSPSWNSGSDTAVGQFNTIIADVIESLNDVGMNIIPVDANLVYDPSGGDVSTDNVHPNDQGHKKIAQAFIDADTAIRVYFREQMI